MPVDEPWTGAAPCTAAGYTMQTIVNDYGPNEISPGEKAASSVTPLPRHLSSITSFWAWARRVHSQATARSRSGDGGRGWRCSPIRNASAMVRPAPERQPYFRFGTEGEATGVLIQGTVGLRAAPNGSLYGRFSL